MLVVLGACGAFVPAACSRGGPEGVGSPPDVPVAILVPERSAHAAERFLDLARAAFPAAREIRADAIESRRPDLLSGGFVLVAPAAADVTPAAWMSVERYVAEGGAVVVWGSGAPVDLLDEERRLPDALRQRYSTSVALVRRELPWDESMPETFGGSVNSLFGGPTGAGGPSAPGVRAIPLATAESEGRAPRGAPAVMILDGSREGPLRRWAYLGIDPLAGRDAMLIALLRDAAVRLSSGRLFLRHGVDRYAFEPGASLDVLAEIMAGPATGESLRVVAELLDAEGRVTRRVGAAVSPLSPLRLNLGNLPRDAALATDFTLRMNLWDAQESQLHDRVDQRILLLPSRRTPASEPASVLGLSIVIGRRAVFPYGFRYAPAGFDPEPPAGRAHWLDAGWFRPEVVQRDLDRLWEMGINAVALNVSSTSQIPQLAYVLEQLRSRNLWSVLFVDGLDSIDPNAAREAVALVAASRISGDESILLVAGSARDAIDRPRADPDRDLGWRRWLGEQYGGASAARDIFGSDGDQGPVAAAAWRRYRADRASRMHGYVRRSLRDAGVRSLLGIRIDPDRAPECGGAVHGDVMLSPIDAALRDAADPAEIALRGVLARAISAGKPVFWLDAGASAGSLAGVNLKQQAARLDAQLAAIARSNPAGILFAQFAPPSRRQQVDLAASEPDGMWRPAGDVIRGLGGRLRRDVTPPLPWRGRVLQAATIARGRAGLLEDWRDAVALELDQGTVEEMRMEGFGEPSTDAARVTVYGLSIQGPAPLLMMNAEWGRVNGSNRFPGEPVAVAARRPATFELLNTGPARWIAGRESQPGTVWVRASHENGIEQRIPVPTAVHGATVTISWTPGDAGRWRLRAYWGGVGGFGETLDVRVAP